MNQAVIRMYLFILVVLASVLLAFLPPLPAAWRKRWVGFARFGVVLIVGLVLTQSGFHEVGRIAGPWRPDPEHLVVLEEFPGRAYDERVWTRVDLAAGTADALDALDALELAGLPEVKSSTHAAFRLVPTLRGRIERREDGGTWRPIGPRLEQPVELDARADGIVISAFEENYRPDTLLVARHDADGARLWRLNARDLGLAAGRVRRSLTLENGDLVLVLTGNPADASLWDKLTFTTRAAVARIDVTSGSVLWTVRF